MVTQLGSGGVRLWPCLHPCKLKLLSGFWTMLCGTSDWSSRLQGFCKCLIITVTEAGAIAMVLLLNNLMTGLVPSSGIWPTSPFGPVVPLVIPKYKHPEMSLNTVLRQSLQTCLAVKGSLPSPFPGVWRSTEEHLFKRAALSSLARQLGETVERQQAACPCKVQEELMWQEEGGGQCGFYHSAALPLENTLWFGKWPFRLIVAFFSLNKWPTSIM